MSQTYVLNGVVNAPYKDEDNITPAGPMQSLFLEGEKELALQVARCWYDRGWKPVLTAKTYDGQFDRLYDYRLHDKMAKARAARKKKAA